MYVLRQRHVEITTLAFGNEQGLILLAAVGVEFGYKSILLTRQFFVLWEVFCFACRFVKSQNVGIVNLPN